MATKNLHITHLSLRNFRSYESFELDDIDALTIFVGPNASGKTNAVEAIHLLTALTSFRGATSQELVGRSTPPASRIAARIEGDGRILDIEMRIEADQRKWQLNGKSRTVKDLRGTLPSIAFTPDDLQLVKGSNKLRRHEIDQLGAQLNANYYQVIRDFDKLLRQKNHLLKDNPSPATLAAINDVFAVVGARYSSLREALFERLMPKAAAHYAHLSNNKEQLGYRYERSWEGELADKLAQCSAEEIARGRALVGSHLDQIELTINTLDASTYASQGQQRTIVLALKLAEVDLIEELRDQPPVLLLDDVMSELDSTRREALLKRLLQNSQTFITTANIDYFDSETLKKARIINLD